LRSQLYSGTEHVVREVKKKIIQTVDNLSSTNFFFPDETKQQPAFMGQKPFPHPCTSKGRKNKCCPTVVSAQELRTLRCKRKYDTVFAFCNECSTTWTPTEMVCSYLQHHVQCPNIQSDYNANIRRLKNKTTEFQLFADNNAVIDKWVVDAAYNHHVHTSSCFKHKFGVDKSSALCDECRYRYPQLKRLKTTIQDSTETKNPWYLWNGQKQLRDAKELYVQRSEYNLFQNVCCPHISYSKLTCNTNISLLLPGPVAQYCVGYTMKNTQDDEIQEYELVRTASEKILSKVKVDDTSRRVAVRRLIGTSFAHQSNNIVGAAMASYLTRNGSRFHFSHSFTWCPLRDLDKLLHGEKIKVNVSFTQHHAYFHCLALNYLCRPQSLEHVPVFDFYTKYDVCTINKNNKSTVLQFHNTRYFQHPSYDKTNKQFRQGVQPTTTQFLAKVFQYDFPDSATFEGDILLCNTPINSYMEQYSKYVLILFHPFRNKNQLLLNGFFTHKLRKVVADGHLHDSACTFLQNLQDTKSNNLRNSSVTDELQRTTTLPSHLPIDSVLIQENDDSSESEYDFLHLNDILQTGDEFDDYVHLGPNTDHDYNVLPQSYNCDDIRNKGRDDCGTSRLPDFTKNIIPTTNDFCISNTPSTLDPSTQTRDKYRTSPTQTDLVSILFTHKDKQRRSFTDITGQKNRVSVYKPNGSAKSIVDWAKKSNFDSNQRRAFEVIAGSFVLSFYDTAITANKEARATCKSESKRLRTLVHNNKWKSNQLICFLHGPGGSGKSAVIDLVVLYAHSFCKYLWTDFDTSERVIVVTAMTGVAATLLQGETTHAALFLNQKKDITREQVERWSPTRLVIIDEISFASKQDIVMINSKLAKLKQQHFLRYGGINIIFCGDFRQLEPVGANKLPIYDENVHQFRDWINCYIELKGLWRFKHDIQWGQLLQRIRDGNVTSVDIESINNHLLKNTIIPQTVRYATYFNVDRDSINAAIFHERLKAYYTTYNSATEFLLIFSDNIYIQDSSKVYKHFNKPNIFWEKFGENDIKMPNGTGRMDPVLKLYYGCSVMLPTNINVAIGQANGTQATVEKVVLKQGEQTTIIEMDGIPVPSVLASQIDCVHLRHSNTRAQPQTFTITPKSHTFKLKFRKMKATQLPMLLNNATTGHKLQGSSVDHLFVHKWSNVTNWNYVMLSRVRTMKGLYARKPLDCDLSKYALKPSYAAMVKKFQHKKPSQLTDRQYQSFLHSAYS
jgi:PIF1-like helicase